MTGTVLSSENLSQRKRRILFRAWHRGTREMDLLLGRFVDAILVDIPEEKLDELEALMAAPDTELYAWISGKTAVPDNFDTPLYREIVDFYASK